MPTMRADPVSILRAAVKRSAGRLGPGLFGLACSGGVDSMALADAAIEVCGAQSVVVIHVDHGLREDSARVGAEVAAWAQGRGVTAIVRRVTVSRDGSLEAAARTARYAALTAVADELGLASLWIAHTRDDQAETVLMRIVRGTGPAGLAAMAEQRERFVRPLLELSRATVRAYHAARALPAWDDPMNRDERITRVRFREQLMPKLRAENPALDVALVRLADTAREWLDVIDALARPHAYFPLRCAHLRALAPGVRKRGYAIALEAAQLGYNASVLEQLDGLVMRETAGEVRLDIAGAQLVRSYDEIRIERPGGAPVIAGLARRHVHVPDGYAMRHWQAGDRMKPARLKGRSRKLSDLYVDAKVPRELRRTARIIVRTADQVIVWAEYIGPAFGEGFGDI